MRILIAAIALALASPIGAQQSADPMLARIEAEGRDNSQVAELFFHLTDVIGARLSGSDSYRQAAEWTRDQLADWGLSDPRLETFDFGQGWELDRLRVEMTDPRYMPLTGYAEAWSPSTAGVLTGTPIYIGDRSLPEIQQMAPQLRGAIVLTHLPQTEFVETDRPQPAGPEGSVRTGNPPGVPVRSEVPLRDLLPVLRDAGAGVLIRPTQHEHGTVLVLGNRATPEDGPASILLGAEQYNMLVRLTEAGVPVEVTVEVQAHRSGSATDNGINVLAEIPGTDPRLRDQIVMVGAHLDSWHASNGATDNGDGVVAAMEAMRILKVIGAQPRRTIRVALWGGEEQGLLGARAYVERHLTTPAERDRISVYLNDDPGSGATYGFYMEENAAAKSLFDSWLQPLSHLGVRRNVIEGIGSTDHLAFTRVGIPAFTTIKDFTDYDVVSRHTNQDFLERVSVDDLRQSAIVLASIVWQAAMADEEVPIAGREASTGSLGGQGILRMLFIDQTTGAPAAGIELSLQGTDARGISGADGIVRLGPVPAGEYELHVVQPGHPPFSGAKVRVLPDQTVQLTMNLRPRPELP